MPRPPVKLVAPTTAASGRIQRTSAFDPRNSGSPIIALSRLSRLVEQRSPPSPILSDLRDSGSIEQDADIVMMLYREDVYNEDCERPGVADVYIRKHRSGTTGRVSLFFDPERIAFASLSKRGGEGTEAA